MPELILLYLYICVIFFNSVIILVRDFISFPPWRS